MSEGYEKKDVSVSAIVLGAVFTVLLIVFFVVILDGYFFFNKEKYIYENVLNIKSTELQEIRKAEEQMLTNYSLLDEDKGIYQIPIEEAMGIIVKEYAQK